MRLVSEGAFLKIEIVDEKTVKVSLTRADMDDLNVCYDGLDYKNPLTRKMIVEVLEIIKSRLNLDLTEEKLIIEAFPYIDGGCILYIKINSEKRIVAAKKQKPSFNTPIIFRFKDINELSMGVSFLSKLYFHIILESSLYLLDDSYYLLIYSYFKMDDRISSALSECGEFYGKGAVKSAFLKEHGKELIKSDAVKKLCSCLN